MRKSVLTTLILVCPVLAGCLGSMDSPAADAATPDSAGSIAGDLSMPPTGDLASTAGGCSTVPRTCAEITSTFPSDPSLLVTCDDKAGTFTIYSTGIPNYSSNQKTPNAIGDQMWIVVLPINPSCAATPVDVVNSRGAIGFMVNGVPFYGPQDAQGRDAIVNEGVSFDDCLGHADQRCSYHYHEEPTCVFGKGMTAAMRTLPDGHPPVIGYAMDGFAIYASPSAGALDACNGLVDAKRGYHYHATRSSPYLLGCYAGKPSGRMMATPSCTAATDGGTPAPTDGGKMPPGMDGGLMDCGAGGMCQRGFVCRPAGLRCANKCVPDCRLNGMCPAGLTCDANSGACK